MDKPEPIKEPEIDTSVLDDFIEWHTDKQQLSQGIKIEDIIISRVALKELVENFKKTLKREYFKEKK